MGAYENPKLTVIDPSKNLEAFERNFNKAYQAMATYRQEKAKREKAYEDAAFAVGVDMYKNIDNAEHFGKEGERAIYESTSSGTQYIMSNKLNKLEQAGLARSHKEVVDVFSKIAQGMYVTPLQLDLSHEDNDKWMELRRGLDDKENIRINMKLDDTGRQPRYVGEITYKVDGETKTVTHTELAVLMGSMEESAKQKTVKDAKLTTDIQKIIDIANAKQDKKSANEQYGTREQSIQEAISENPLDLNDQQTVDFIYENKLTASEQGVMDFDNFTSVNEFKKAQVLKWLPNQLSKVKTNKPPKEGRAGTSVAITKANYEVENIYNDLNEVVNGTQTAIMKTEFGSLGILGPSQLAGSEAIRVQDYEAMADEKANKLALTMNSLIPSGRDGEQYYGRGQALEVYKKKIRDDFEANNEGKIWNEVDDDGKSVNPELSDYALNAQFNNTYKRKSTGKDAKPELFYVETKSNGTLTFPFPREFTNTEQLTRQVMAGRGVLNYDPKIFERLSNRQSGL